MVNRNAWEKLPAEYREIFAAASQEAASAMQSRYDEKNPADARQQEARRAEQIDEGAAQPAREVHRDRLR